MTLRRRLTATMIVLVALGLTVVDVVTLSSLRSYLYGRVDEQLNAAQLIVQNFVLHADARGLTVNPAEIESRVSPTIYVEIVGLGGAIVVSRPSGTDTQQDPPPKLPRPLPVRPAVTRAQLSRTHGTYRPSAASVNVESTTRNGPEYRLQASALPGETLVVATRLDSVDATLASLRTIELAVSFAVVAGLLALMTLLIRRGLRPLEDMTAAADTIAAGDLTRRVRPSDGNSEIGRLGRALNGMLAQIEAAFDQRSTSEDRLRRFVADASHELRTPLTSIRGYAELLRKDAIDDEDGRERALARVESEAARMGRLVEDLLLLARLGVEPEPEQRRVDLVPVVIDAVADARAVDDGRPMTVSAPHPVFVAGDEQRLGQLIHNLLRNAQAHTPPGTPVDITVFVDGARAVLRVRDQGPGMDAEEARRIFDRFYRGESARSNDGTGLGLFIVAAITRALGGTVSVDTAVGEGSTFEVVLPAHGSGPPPGTAIEGVDAAHD